jgi:hypothetical protein
MTIKAVDEAFFPRNLELKMDEGYCDERFKTHTQTHSLFSPSCTALRNISIFHNWTPVLGSMTATCGYPFTC